MMGETALQRLKAKGMSKILLEGLIVFYAKEYPNCPDVAEQVAAELARLRAIEAAAREYVFHGKNDSYAKLAAILQSSINILK